MPLCEYVCMYVRMYIHSSFPLEQNGNINAPRITTWACMHACIHTCMHGAKWEYQRSKDHDMGMYVCMHTYMYVCVCTYIPLSRRSKMGISTLLGSLHRSTIHDWTPGHSYSSFLPFRSSPCMYACMYVCMYVCEHQMIEHQDTVIHLFDLFVGVPACMHVCMHACMYVNITWLNTRTQLFIFLTFS
jgi:hypothetical protein